MCVVLGMFAFGFLLVPIYNVLCDELGINGKTKNQANFKASTGVDKTRTITVEFISTNNGNNLPWEFYPSVKKLTMHPGQMKRLSFIASNRSERTMAVQAIPSVTPGIAARYLKKTECFCFTRQVLKAKERVDMPLLFHLDRDLPKKIKTLTLSYTLFDVTHFKNSPTKTPGRIS